MSIIDLTGRRVGKLTVLRRTENVGRQPAWCCLCDCGVEKRVLGMHLRAGRPLDCGCGQGDRIRAVHQTHGMTGNKEYHTWRGLKGRCENPTHKQYPAYGGRGITLCDRWRDSFESFYADMGPRPAGTTLDRIDNDGPYSPDNCRWATAYEQQNNRRSNVRITLDGETRTMKQWAMHFGIPYPVVKDRRANGVTGADLFAPLVRRKYRTKYTHAGKSLTISEWAKELGAPYITVWQRIHLADRNPDGSHK